jgi:hypothetical protein
MRTLLPVSGTAGVGALLIARNVRFTRQFAGNGEKVWEGPLGGPGWRGLVGAAAGGVSPPLGLALPSPLGRWARDTAAGSDDSGCFVGIRGRGRDRVELLLLLDGSVVRRAAAAPVSRR